jgi:hypothetical protein
MIPSVIQKETTAYSKWIKRMGKDPRLYATHISLFTAMFVCWQRSGVATFDWREKEGRFNLKIKFDKDEEANV